MKLCTNLDRVRCPDKVYLAYNSGGGIHGSSRRAVFIQPPREKMYIWGKYWYELDKDEILRHIMEVL